MTKFVRQYFESTRHLIIIPAVLVVGFKIGPASLRAVLTILIILNLLTWITYVAIREKR